MSNVKRKKKKNNNNNNINAKKINASFSFVLFVIKMSIFSKINI